MPRQETNRLVRAICAAAAVKLTRAGYEVPGNPSMADLAELISRETGQEIPKPAGLRAWIAEYAAAVDGASVATQRQHDALQAPVYRPSLAMQQAAARAAQWQPPIKAAVSNIDNWRELSA